MPGVLLEVTVTHERDAAGAQEGGADRLHVVLPTAGEAELSPEVATVSAVCHATDLPVFALLRLSDSGATDADELDRLAARGQDFLACGVAGVSFGFLDADLELDVAACLRLVQALPGVPWTCHSVVDATLDHRRTWRRLIDLPQLVQVHSGGSVRGMGEGFDDLLGLVGADAAIARLAMPGGGLQAEHVPWLVRAGVRAFHLGPQTRPGGSRRAYVDAGLVRSWRTLFDDALGHVVPPRRMILVDPPLVESRGRLWSHLASDTSYDELHEFARTLGIPERGFDRDHYDVPGEWYDQVVALGATPVSSRELVARLSAAGLRRRKSR